MLNHLGRSLCQTLSLDLNLSSLGFMNFLSKRKLLCLSLELPAEVRGDFPGAIVLRRHVSLGYRRWTASISWSSVCVVHTVQWCERAKWVYPALHWANNKRDTKTIYRSPSVNNRGVRLFVCNSTCNTEDTVKIAWKDCCLNATDLLKYVIHNMQKLLAYMLLKFLLSVKSYVGIQT